MERGLLSDNEVEQDDAAFMDFAFDTHPDAYWNAGLKDLSWLDKAKIATTPDLKEWKDKWTWGVRPPKWLGVRSGSGSTEAANPGASFRPEDLDRCPTCTSWAPDPGCGQQHPRWFELMQLPETGAVTAGAAEQRPGSGWGLRAGGRNTVLVKLELRERGGHGQTRAGSMQNS